MDEDRVIPPLSGADKPVDGENSLRVVVLASIYAAAVFFAIAFSPAIGFVAPGGIAPISHEHIASAGGAVQVR